MILQTLSAIVVIVAIALTPVLCHDDILCANPRINGADRFPNDTARIYRDDYYWDLTAFPEDVLRVNGPFKRGWENLFPFEKGSSITTVTEGFLIHRTYKFTGTKFWHWDSRGGMQVEGGRDGLPWPHASPPIGIESTFHVPNKPEMIAIHGTKVYYYDTSSANFRLKNPGGSVNGLHGENFPTDIDAAFAIKSTEPEAADYWVYLFKKDKYCFRSNKGADIPESAKGCKEWRDNKELFGCYRMSSKSPPKPAPKDKPSEDETKTKPEASNGSIDVSYNQYIVILLIVFHFI